MEVLFGRKHNSICINNVEKKERMVADYLNRERNRDVLHLKHYVRENLRLVFEFILFLRIAHY